MHTRPIQCTITQLLITSAREGDGFSTESTVDRACRSVNGSPESISVNLIQFLRPILKRASRAVSVVSRLSATRRDRGVDRSPLPGSSP